MKNKYIFYNLFTIILLMVLIIISIMKKNISAIILVTFLFFMWLSGNIILALNKKRFSQLIKWYLPLKKARNYDEILRKLENHKSFYFEKVIYTNTLLFKGDEEKYILYYKKINNKRIYKGYHFNFLNYTHVYYIILKNGFNNLSILKEDIRFPLNKCINFVIQGKYRIALSECAKIRGFDTEFMNYFILYLQYICKKNLSETTSVELSKMDKLISGNNILNESFNKHIF